MFGDKELVLDLETAAVPSNVPGERNLVAILSVGMVVFHPSDENTFDQLLEKDNYNVDADYPDRQFVGERVFYTPMNLMQTLAAGFDTDPSTLKFWNDQVVKRGSYNPVAGAAAFTQDLKFTVALIEQFMKKHHDVKRVWCRDQSFDLTILREAMNHLGFELPINPFIASDHRVACKLLDIGFPKVEGQVFHHALHDAAIEALMVQQLFRTIHPTVKGAAPEDTAPDEPAKAKAKKAPPRQAKVTASKPKPVPRTRRKN